MVNCVDNEKLLKNIITQFCDQNFKFTLNLKILGSIHVQVDNSEVLTCLLDEKFFKTSQNRSLITTNQNLFNPLSVKPLSENNTAFNLVTTLNQLQQQQQQHQLKLVNTSQQSNIKIQSLSSSSSTSSSASSYLSGESKQHKRKRSNGQKSDDGLSSSSVSSRSRRENHQSDDEEEDEANTSDHNENENDENLNNSSSDQTPVKRNKVDEPDEAAAAAANALSLISAAAVASKLYNQQNTQPQHGFHNIAAHLNPYQAYAPSSSEAEQAGPSAVAGSSSKPLKPKAKFLTNDYEQQLKQQIFQQSIENSAPSYHGDQEAKKAEEDQESSLEESQLYMDEDNNKNDKENEEQNVQVNQNGQQSEPQPTMHLQQQQLIMAAAAAAFMNSNSTNQQASSDNSNLKLFMPHNLALNLPKTQTQSQPNIPNGEKSKKKSKTTSLMSPSSSLVSNNGPISNKSSSSVSSSSSSASTSSAKSNKKSRQTIAALAAAAASVRPSTAPNPLAPSNQNTTDSQRNLNHNGLKDTSNIDQIITEVTDKSKISLASPKPPTIKHLKKQHLLSASVSSHSPALPKKEKAKKSKANEQSALTPNGLVPVIANQVIQPTSQQNPAQAAAAAAAAALQYHHFLNNNLKINSVTPQKPNPKFHLANGGYVEENENRMKVCKYEDADEEEPCDDEEVKDNQQQAHLNGPLSIKSLTGPLTQSNTNTPSQGPNGSTNMEFECTACEKKFKYYCYYKRHMDACHSDMPKYVCDTCNKSYKWEASFRQHLRSHHTTGQSGGNHEENGEGKFDGDENNENHAGHDMKENEEDTEEPDVGTNEDERMHQNERLFYERDHEQIGAAGTLASIADSLNGMQGRLMINN